MYRKTYLHVFVFEINEGKIHGIFFKRQVWCNSGKMAFLFQKIETSGFLYHDHGFFSQFIDILVLYYKYIKMQLIY